jgi:hypothetical protein
MERAAVKSELSTKSGTQSGIHAFIVPKPALVSENYQPIRRFVLEHHLDRIADSGTPFIGVGVETTIMVVRRASPQHGIVAIDEIVETDKLMEKSKVPQKVFANLPFTGFSYLLNHQNLKLISKIASCGRSLAELASLFSRGIEAGKRGSDITTTRSKNARKLLRGEDVTRYLITFRGFCYNPSLSSKKEWKSVDLYECPEKILIRRVANNILAALDSQSYWTLNTLYTFVPKEGVNSRYLLGCINSKLLSYYFRIVFLSDDKLFPYLRISQLEKLPVYVPNFSDSADKSRHDRMVELVELMLDLHKRISAAKTEHEKTVLQRQIDATDKQIDNLVYELYNLTEEEIKIVEAARE